MCRRTHLSIKSVTVRQLGTLQQFSVDLNQDGLPGLGEDLRH
jgi:hypothetical protein